MLVNIDRIFPMGKKLLRFTASLSSIQGDRWEVIFAQEGEFVDKKHYVTKDALERAQAANLFEQVYVQELEFQDNTTRHLPGQLDGQAPGGVFHNVVGVITDTTLKVLDTGKTAIVGFIEAVDETWKNKMRTLAAKGLKLPGVSFNALIPQAGIKDRINENGNQIRDIFEFQQIDTVEVVSYPNAGGQILRAVAAEEPPLTNDRNPFMKHEFIKYLSLRNISVNEDELAVMVKAAVEADEFKQIPVVEQRLVESLDGLDEEKAERIVASLIDLAEKKEQDPVSVTINNPAPEPQEPEQVQAGAQDPFEHFDKKFEERINSFTQRLDQAFEQKAKQFEEESRVQAGIQLIEGSSLTPKMKSLAIDQFKSSQKSATEILDSFTEAVAPFAEEGRVRAAQNPYNIAYGSNNKDKQKMGLLRLIGGQATEKRFTAEEKSMAQDVPAFRSLGHAFTVVTGLNAEYMTLEEFNNPSRIKADINMFEIADFPYVLGDTLNRAIVDQFMDQPHTWEEFTVQRRGVRDFKNLKINRVGGFTVPLDTYTDTGTGVSTREEGGITLVAPPSEQQGTYAPSIYANQFALTYQTLRNDDIGMVQTWLRRFAEACDETALYQTMMAFINDSSGTINGGTISLDSKALYHADHNNISTSALTYESLRAACAMIRAQTDGLGSSKPLNQQPFMLVIPESLRDTGEVLIGTNQRPLSADNDINTMSYLKLVILHDFWLGSDANNWYVTSDPKREKSAFLEIAFLDDKSVPTILTANNATAGRMFTHLRTEFSGVFIFGIGHRGYESVQGNFPT